MISVLALSVVDRGFESRSRQIKDYKIGICCFSAKHAALRRKTGWLGIRIMCPQLKNCSIGVKQQSLTPYSNSPIPFHREWRSLMFDVLPLITI